MVKSQCLSSPSSPVQFVKKISEDDLPLHTCMMQLMIKDKPEKHPQKRKKNNHNDTEGGVTATKTKTKTTVSSRWEGIPHDILELVLLKLQPIEYANILRVCKSWGELKPLPCFPQIVFHNNSVKVRVDDEVCLSRYCIGSYHGWLIIRLFSGKKKNDKNLDMELFSVEHLDMELFSDEKDDDADDDKSHKTLDMEFYFLLNVFTKSTMQLPWLDRTTKNPTIFFSSAPTDPDCTLLMLDGSFPTFLFCNKRCNKWIEADHEYPLYSKEPPTHPNYLYTAISLGGKFYVLSSQGNLVAIDINVAAASLPNAAAAATITVLPVTNIRRNQSSAVTVSPEDWFLVESLGKLPVANLRRRIAVTVTPDDWFLVESLGELLMVTCYREKKDWIMTELYVLRLDFKTMSWIEMKSLPGDQVLFLGRDCSLSIAASKIWGVNNNSNGEGRGGGGKYIYVADNFTSDTFRYDMHSKEMMLSTVFPSNYYSGKEEDKKQCLEMFWVRPPTAFV